MEKKGTYRRVVKKTKKNEKSEKKRKEKEENKNNENVRNEVSASTPVGSNQPPKILELSMSSVENRLSEQEKHEALKSSNITSAHPLKKRILNSGELREISISSSDESHAVHERLANLQKLTELYTTFNVLGSKPCTSRASDPDIDQVREAAVLPEEVQLVDVDRLFVHPAKDTTPQGILDVSIERDLEDDITASVSEASTSQAKEETHLSHKLTDLIPGEPGTSSLPREPGTSSLPREPGTSSLPREPGEHSVPDESRVIENFEKPEYDSEAEYRKSTAPPKISTIDDAINARLKEIFQPSDDDDYKPRKFNLINPWKPPPRKTIAQRRYIRQIMGKHLISRDLTFLRHFNVISPSDAEGTGLDDPVVNSRKKVYRKTKGKQGKAQQKKKASLKLATSAPNIVDSSDDSSHGLDEDPAPATSKKLEDRKGRALKRKVIIISSESSKQDEVGLVTGSPRKKISRPWMLSPKSKAERDKRSSDAFDALIEAQKKKRK